ncbi:hypothetical protein C8R46DRAFT_1067837 [Mycena filopes]|nr:hypothetical protein C8R46DRAFT_1067837 [Mycena filopes]
MTSSPAHGIMDKTICAPSSQEGRQREEEVYPCHELDSLCASAIVGRVRMPTTATDTIWFPETTRAALATSDIHRRPESARVLGDVCAATRTHTSGPSSCLERRTLTNATIQTEDQGRGMDCRVGGVSSPMLDSSADDRRDRGGVKPDKFVLASRGESLK